MRFGFFVLFILIFTSSVAYAENSFLASAYNQLRHGGRCGNMTRDDLKKAGMNCGFGQPIDKIPNQAWEIYEWNVFHLAAENQIDKNQCLSGQVEKMMEAENAGHFKSWSSQVAVAWLVVKKADLILERCHLQVMKKGWTARSSGPSQPKKVGEDPRCSNPEEIAKIHFAKNLAALSVPIVSNPEFFKVVEKHRQILVNDKTGNPLTDEELLATKDLKKLDFLKLKHSPHFEEDLRKSLKDLSDERNRVTQDLKKFRSGKMVSLPTDLKDYIHDDGTLYQTLISNDFLPKEHKGMNTPKSAISSGTFCLLSKYEPTLPGELIDMAAKSVISGGFLFKLFQGTRAVSFLSKVHVTSKLDYGMSGAALTLAGEQINKSCINKNYQARKTVSGKMEREAARSSDEISADLALGGVFEIDLGKVPECKKAEDKNLMLNQSYLTNCLQDALLSLI